MDNDKVEFVCWDGEGAKTDPRNAQDYVLLGTNVTAPIVGKRLSTEECLAYIIDVGRQYPKAQHIGFAFDYDANQILQDLSEEQFRRLSEVGRVHYGQYDIEHLPGKWLTVQTFNDDGTLYGRTKIQDTFGFFQCSFLKALDQYIPDDPLMKRLDQLSEGKSRRNDFSWKDIEYIKAYWELEIQLFHQLAQKLKEYLWHVDLKIKQWHGPGAIANHVFKRHRIDKAKCDPPKEVMDASRYAYAAGRFERFHIGRFKNVYSMDINSAYPWGISQLPDLTEGEWVHVRNPKVIEEFGVYHISLSTFDSKNVGPLFHRDSWGSITFPGWLEGWYWSPEAQTVLGAPGVEISEGWVYVGWKNSPFEFVSDMYEQRREMKAKKQGAQMALKLCLNSLYGKMAQRAGWERYGTAPKWHQLSWAGWVTSKCRATLYDAMKRIPYAQVIAVETDGLYTTCPPEMLGISDSKMLGGWEVSHYDEMLYLQSGVYAYRIGDEWGIKYRGLDKGSLAAEDVAAHLHLCFAECDWPTIKGPTTRFVGYKAALMGRDFHALHRHWITTEREISIGSVGKRQHAPAFLCEACKNGATAYRQPHDTMIVSKAQSADKAEWHSTMHDIPWQDPEKLAAWEAARRENEKNGDISIW